jgi:hypothetical protein
LHESSSIAVRGEATSHQMTLRLDRFEKWFYDVGIQRAEN